MTRPGQWQPWLYPPVTTSPGPAPGPARIHARPVRPVPSPQDLDDKVPATLRGHPALIQARAASPTAQQGPGLDAEAASGASAEGLGRLSAQGQGLIPEAGALVLNTDKKPNAP